MKFHLQIKIIKIDNKLLSKKLLLFIFIRVNKFRRLPS